jgi:RNA polymerase sigma factor (sigma-70 family)
VAAGASELAAGVRDVSPREELLEELRPVAFAIAYRMLGSVSEAEDVVQEALLRVHQALEAGKQIASPRDFVATVTTRLAIDELRSARARREEYVGEWLPEPIITDGRGDPARHAEMADSLSLALLVLLESLSPEQRAVLVLHDVFGFDHAQIAQMIGKSQDNVRQLATRARRHVQQRRPRFQTTREQRDELARRFFAAVEHGDLPGLEALLARDVELTGDGGGNAPALARSRRGRSRVARTLIDWSRLAARAPGRSLRPVEVNGGPGALYLDAQQRLIAVVALEIAGGQVTSISAIVNPDKLAHLGPVGDWTSPRGVGEMNSGAVAASPRAAVPGPRPRPAGCGAKCAPARVKAHATGQQVRFFVAIRMFISARGGARCQQTRKQATRPRSGASVTPSTPGIWSSSPRRSTRSPRRTC